MKHPKNYDTTPAVRKRMSQVKLKNGDCETKLAHALWHRGIRYRLNYKMLPGSPDIAITKYKIAVFVDGEFWHGYDWENRKEKLKSNREYWIEKIEENIARDARVNNDLTHKGWHVLHFWSTDISRNLEECVDSIVDVVESVEK